jgi:VIT1/CCC1 family predicted Fe2+/Mn2+ transporter
MDEQPKAAGEPKPSSKLPLARFLSDFTLGFSDGLTVPFALTAGLSSLGRADTVIYAGFAELCAGSISMGIGGYLSALDDARCAATGSHGQSQDDGDEEGDIEEARRSLLRHRDSAIDTSSEDGVHHDEHKSSDTDEERIRRHLQPLNLPPHLIGDILATVGSRHNGLESTASALGLQQQQQQQPCRDEGDGEAPTLIWPVGSGLSISLGYVVGGLIPLLPYFVAPNVGSGLCWSIGLCLVALFAFGFGKCWLLSEARSHWRQSLIEGFRMLILGSLAAVASVACIKLLESSTGGSP